jgi:TonB family protein
MKPFSRPLLGAALLAALLSPASRAGAAPADEDSGVVIHQTGRVLVFPPKALSEGVPSGEVQVVLSVDAKGGLTDCLVVGYTLPEFAEAATAALKTWTYEPAHVHGRARASRLDLLITFKSEINVLVVSASLHFFERVSNEWGSYSYKTCKLADLDRIPTPVHVIQPVLSKTDADRAGVHVVTVEFFIDEEGRVRVPTVAREFADDAYAAAMVAAVEQWRFEPPQRRGHPVLVLAQQDFNFRSKPPGAP